MWTWSLFLSGHLYLSDTSQGFSQNKHQKDMCYDGISLCAQIIDTIPCSYLTQSIGRTYVIIGFVDLKVFDFDFL